MVSTDEMTTVRGALGDLERAVNALRRRAGDTLGVRRLCTDVRRIGEDLAEIGPLPEPEPAPPRRAERGTADGPLQAVEPVGDSEIYPEKLARRRRRGSGRHLRLAPSARAPSRLVRPHTLRRPATGRRTHATGRGAREHDVRGATTRGHRREDAAARRVAMARAGHRRRTHRVRRLRHLGGVPQQRLLRQALHLAVLLAVHRRPLRRRGVEVAPDRRLVPLVAGVAHPDRGRSASGSPATTTARPTTARSGSRHRPAPSASRTGATRRVAVPADPAERPPLLLVRRADLRGHPVLRRVRAFIYWPRPRRFGMGLGTLVMLVNVVFIWLYTASCHSCRHLVRRPAQRVLEASDPLPAVARVSSSTSATSSSPG